MGPQLAWMSRSRFSSPCLTAVPGSAAERYGVWVAVTKVMSTAEKYSNRPGLAWTRKHNQGQ